MTNNTNWNFAGRLVSRLGPYSYLIDGNTGEAVVPSRLPREISAWGAGFLAAGAEKGDRIIIGCALSLPTSLAYLGAMYAGLVPVMVEQRALMRSGDVFVRETGAKAVWTERQLRFQWEPEQGLIALHGDIAENGKKIMPPVHCSQDDLAALMPTSGSSGTPRFVMVTHGNLIANTEAIIRSQSLGKNERAMLILPLSYCFGASVLHTHLYHGGGVVFHRQFMFPDKVLHAINIFGCTSFAGVPMVFNVLLRRSNIRAIPLPTLKRFLQAGGALSPQKITEVRRIVPWAKFYVMYGQTEAVARISCLDPDRLDTKLGSVGQPLDNLTVSVVDDEGRPVPAGQIGEIVVEGPSVCRGYFNDAAQTKRVFKGGRLRTRDIGFLDEDGYIWLRGRKEEFLKMRGVRVSLSEVEAEVGQVPGVYECAAAVVPHPEAGEAVALFIVPERDTHQIAERVRRCLPANWTCAKIDVVSMLPRTPSGKVSRKELQKWTYEKR